MTLSSNSDTLSVAWQGSGATSSRIIDFTLSVMRSARPLCTDKLKLREFNHILSVRKPGREGLGCKLHRLLPNPALVTMGTYCLTVPLLVLWTAVYGAAARTEKR